MKETVQKKISIFSLWNVFRHPLAVFLAVTFLVPAEAARAFPVVRPAEISQLEETVLSLRELPAHLGRIEERYQGESGLAVVLIQDAHGIPEAQRNIRDLIFHFRNQYGVRLAGVEGAAARLDAGLIKSFPSTDAVEKVSEEYMERGELTGSAAAALSDDSGIVFQGVEDWDLYQKGLGLYLAALNREAGLLEKAAVRRQILEDEKKRVYSPELLAVDRALSAFEHDGAGLLEALKACARTRAPESGSELALILKESLREGTSASSEQEIRAFALDIKSRMNAGRITVPLSEAKLFYEAEQAFQTSLMTFEAFALFLREWGASNNLSFYVPEAARQGIRDYQRLRDLEGSALLHSFERYARSVKEVLFRNETERDLDRKSRTQSLLERMIRLEISREEWQEWKAAGGEPAAEFTKEELSAHWLFYENADARDQVFFDQLTRAMKKMKTSSALMIAGGFHSEGLTRKLRASGISYLKITPAISEVPSETRYRDHLRGELSWKDYFTVEKGQIDLHGAFIRAFRDRLLEVSKSERPEILKTWRDRVLQQLADQGLLSRAGEYTAYLDDLSDVPEASAGSARLDRFLERLRGLDQQGQAEQENILRLLKSTTIASLEASGLASGARMPPLNRLVESAETWVRSELRSAATEWEGSGEVDVQAILQSVIEQIEDEEIQASRPQFFRTVVYHSPIPARLRVKSRSEDIQALRSRLASVAREVTVDSFWMDSLYTILREAGMNSKDGLDRTAGDIPLDLFVSMEGDELVLRLKDEGPGIHERVLQKKLDRWKPDSRYSTKERRPLEYGAGFRAIYEYARAIGARVEVETVTTTAAGPQGFRLLLEPGARVQISLPESTDLGTVVTVRIPFEKPDAVSAVPNDELNSGFMSYLFQENPNGLVVVHAGDFIREGLAFPVLRAKLRSALQSSKTVVIDAGSFAAVPGSSSPWEWSGSTTANDDALERVEEKIRILGAQMEGAFLDLEGTSPGAGKISPGVVVRELLKNAVYHGNQLDLQRLAAVRVRIERNDISLVEAFDHGVLEPQEYRRPRVVHSSIALSGERVFRGWIEDSASGWAFEGSREGKLVPGQKAADGVSRVSVVRSNRSELRSASVHESMMGQLIYPRTILYAPESSKYSQAQFFEAPVTPARPDDKALKLFQAAFNEYSRIGIKYSEIGKRRKNLKEGTTVLAVDLPAVFYSPAERIGITHVIQISTRRRAILISKKFLESLDPRKSFDLKLVALYLHIGQILIERYDELQSYFRYENQNHGVVSRRLQNVYRSVEQSLENDFSWDQEVFFENMNFNPSDAKLKHLRVVDRAFRQNERERLGADEEDLLAKDEAIRQILAGWDPVNGYSDSEIPEIAGRIAAVVPEIETADQSRQQAALLALKHTIQSLQKRAHYYESEGEREKARQFYKRAEEFYKASQKIDFGGYFPLRVQEELVYFLLRSGSLEELSKELSRLLNVHYVPTKRRPDQLAVHEAAYPLWLILSAPDLLYKLQYYRVGADAQRTELIEQIEKTLTRAYFRELKNQLAVEEKFAVDLTRMQPDELKNPMLIPVPESGDVFSFAWEKMRVGPGHVEVRLEASRWINGPENPDPVGYLDFVLLEDQQGRWSARTSRNQWPALFGQGHLNSMGIDESTHGTFRGIPVILVQLALRLIRKSGAERFSFDLPVELQKKYELPYRDKKGGFRQTLNFKNLGTNELAKAPLKHLSFRHSGPEMPRRSELRTEGFLALEKDAVIEPGPEGKVRKTWIFRVLERTEFRDVFDAISAVTGVSQKDFKRNGFIGTVQKTTDGSYVPAGMGRVDLLEPDSSLWNVPSGQMLRASVTLTAPTDRMRVQTLLEQEAELLVTRLRPDIEQEKAREIARRLVSVTDFPGWTEAPDTYFRLEAAIQIARDFLIVYFSGIAALFLGTVSYGLSVLLRSAGYNADGFSFFLGGALFAFFYTSLLYTPWFIVSAFHGMEGVRIYLSGDLTAPILQKDPEVLGYLTHEWIHSLKHSGYLLDDRGTSSAELLRRYELEREKQDGVSAELFSETLRTSRGKRANSLFAFFWRGRMLEQKKKEFLDSYRAVKGLGDASEETRKRVFEKIDSDKLLDYRGYRFIQALALRLLPGKIESYARSFRLGGAAASLSDHFGEGAGWRFLKEISRGKTAYEAYRGAVPRSELRSEQISQPTDESSASSEFLKNYREAPELLRSAHAVFVVKSSSGQTVRDERMKALHAGRTLEERRSAPVGRNMIRGPEEGLLLRASLAGDEIPETSQDQIVTQESTGFSVFGDSYAYTSFDRVMVHNGRTGVTRIFTHPQFAHLHTVVYSSTGRELLVTSPGFEKIFEIDAETGAVLWEWSAWDHGYSRSNDGSRIYTQSEKTESEIPGVNVVSLNELLETDHRGFGIPTWYRAVHLNDASYDEDGNILASLFYPGKTVKISRATGLAEEMITGLSKPHGFHVLRPGQGREKYLVTNTGAFEAGYTGIYDESFSLIRKISTEGMPGRKDHLRDFPDWQWVQYTTQMTASVVAMVDVVRAKLYLVDKEHRTYRAISVPREWSLQMIVPVADSFSLIAPAADPPQEIRSELREGKADREVFSVSSEAEESALKETALRAVRYLEDGAPDVKLPDLAAEIEKGILLSGFKPFAAAVRGVSFELQSRKVQEYLEKLALIAEGLQENLRGEAVMAFPMDETQQASLEAALGKIFRKKGELQTHIVVPRELAQIDLPASVRKHVVPSVDGISPGQLKFAVNADAIAAITDMEDGEKVFSSKRIFALRASGLTSAGLDAYHAGIVDKATRALAALVLAGHMTRAEQLKDVTARGKLLYAVNLAFFGAVEIDEEIRGQLIRFDEKGLTVDVGMIFTRLTAEAESAARLSRSA